jgi:hypothetical protein
LKQNTRGWCSALGLGQEMGAANTQRARAGDRTPSVITIQGSPAEKTMNHDRRTQPTPFPPSLAPSQASLCHSYWVNPVKRDQGWTLSLLGGPWGTDQGKGLQAMGKPAPWERGRHGCFFYTLLMKMRVSPFLSF